MSQERHPPGLIVLFLTEMWERFSFYSMLAMFTLYLRDKGEGFNWTAAEATTLYSNYLMFVYASPLIGGFLADWRLGYRRSVMIGGLFFMAGHLLLSIRDMTAVYAALTCLVIGNGFFKPNVSTMVGNLYPEGSHLKDRAYNIFYMGINVGAFAAPLVAELVKSYFGFHVAFAVAAFGMLVSVTILWMFRQYVEDPSRPHTPTPDELAESAAVSEDIPPAVSEHEGVVPASSRVGITPSPLPPTPARALTIDQVPEWKRIAALGVIFAIVIVFWMVFHQNGSTLTYWANENTDWQVSGVVSNAINPFWVITLTFPLVWLWGFLDRRGLEPSTPTKMAFGMLLSAACFGILYLAALRGEAQEVRPEQFASGEYLLSERGLKELQSEGMPAGVAEKLRAEDEDKKKIVLGQHFETKEIKDKGEVSGEEQFTAKLQQVLGTEDAAKYRTEILTQAFLFQVSPFWLILAYAVVTLGELLLSPMGLSLVSKVAPIRLRGLLMGGWFVATAIGNKLTAIGVLWDRWLHSSFFALLGLMALGMAIVLILLLRPLKKAMPGV